MRSILQTVIFLVLISIASLAQAETTVYFSPNGGCQAAVIDQINKARRSIDIAMFSFTSKEIAQALLDAKQRQVKIKVVLDTFEIKDRYSKSKFLMKRGIDLKFKMGPGLLHDKFAVIDDRVVLTGSFNWTVTADKRNAENLLVLEDRKLAQKYTKQFKLLWAHSGEGQLKE